MRSVDILFLTSTSNHVQRSPAVQPNRTVAPTSSNDVASKYRPDWGQLRSVGATCVSTSRKQNAQHHFMRSITSAGSPCQIKTILQKNELLHWRIDFPNDPHNFEGLTMVDLSWKLQATSTGCILVLWAGLQAAAFNPTHQKGWEKVPSRETQNMKSLPKSTAASGTSGIPHLKNDTLYPVGPLMPILRYPAKNSGFLFQVASVMSYKSIIYCTKPK